MYYLPFQSRTRFVAFEDTDQVEEYLTQWLVEGRHWDHLEEDTFLKDHMVDGEGILNVFFKRGKTFIVSGGGFPQVQFEGNPRSLLFVHGTYKIAKGSGSFSYDKMIPAYMRYEISPYTYDADEENLEEVWEEINSIKDSSIDPSRFSTLENNLNVTNTKVTKLSQRNDPLDVILPAIAAEAGERETAINDILQQLNDLQAPLATGVVNVTNYPTKDEFYSQLSTKASKGYVEGLIATKASNFSFQSHILDENLHNPTFLTIGSPSLAQYNSLVSRVTDTESRITTQEAINPVKTIQGHGGLLVTNQGNGVWKVDGSYIGVGTGDKPQETSFYMGGLLQMASGTGGKWTSWEDSQILGVRLTVNEASEGAPIVVDIKKKTPSDSSPASIYTTVENRPTLPVGEKTVLASLPDDVMLESGDELTVDIVNVGTLYAGTDLTVQIRFEYVS